MQNKAFVIAIAVALVLIAVPQEGHALPFWEQTDVEFYNVFIFNNQTLTHLHALIDVAVYKPDSYDGSSLPPDFTYSENDYIYIYSTLIQSIDHNGLKLLLKNKIFC